MEKQATRNPERRNYLIQRVRMRKRSLYITLAMPPDDDLQSIFYL